MAGTVGSFWGRVVRGARAAARYLQQHPRLRKGLQLALVLATLVFCAWAVRSEWSDAWPLLQHAKLRYVALAFLTVAAYYLVFILGWMRLLDAWGIRVPYRIALQAEMVSMLAKYLPGGVWTPAARDDRVAQGGRCDGHADGARVDPRRSGSLRDLGGDRLRRQPRLGERGTHRFRRW